MALTKADLIDDIKILLDMEGTTMYDGRLSLLTSSAITELKVEGIDLPTEKNDEIYSNYVVLIAYRIAMSIDIDVNANNLRSLYMTSVNELR